MNTQKLKSRLNGKLQNLQEPQNEGNVLTVPKKNDTALTPTNTKYTAFTNNALDIIQENLKNQPLSFQLPRSRAGL